MGGKGWTKGWFRSREGQLEISLCYSELSQIKTYRLFISGIFLLIFSYFGWLWITETMENKTSDEWGLLYGASSHWIPTATPVFLVICIPSFWSSALWSCKVQAMWLVGAGAQPTPRSLRPQRWTYLSFTQTSFHEWKPTGKVLQGKGKHISKGEKVKIPMTLLLSAVSFPVDV